MGREVLGVLKQPRVGGEKTEWRGRGGVRVVQRRMWTRRRRVRAQAGEGVKVRRKGVKVGEDEVDVSEGQVGSARACVCL